MLKRGPIENVSSVNAGASAENFIEGYNASRGIGNGADITEDYVGGALLGADYAAIGKKVLDHFCKGVAVHLAGGLFDSLLCGVHTEDYVFLVDLGKGNGGVEILEPFLSEQVGVGTVAPNYRAVIKTCLKLGGAVAVCLDDLYLDSRS